MTLPTRSMDSASLEFDTIPFFLIRITGRYEAEVDVEMLENEITPDSVGDAEIVFLDATKVTKFDAGLVKYLQALRDLIKARGAKLVIIGETFYGSVTPDESTILVPTFVEATPYIIEAIQFRFQNLRQP